MLTLVVPTYNERNNLPALLERVEAALTACAEPFEVIVVDDDSPDGTSEVARSLAARHRWLRVLTRKHQRDLSTAVLAGWFAARGEILGVIDGDLQHPPELLPELLRRLRETGADIVIASRHVKGGGVSKWSLFRRLISWAATLMAGFILPGTLSRVRDPMSGFFLLRRPVVENSPLRPVGYKILLEVLAKGDYHRCEEVPYIFQERFQGGSKMGLRTGWQYLLHLASIAVDTGEARRVFRYAAVGTSGAVVNLGVFAALARAAGAPPALALPAATALAIINNFLLNDRFTFPETRRRTPGRAAAVGRFVRFLWVVLIGACLNMTLASALMRLARVPLELAVLAGIGAAAAWNFVLNSRVTWKVWWDRDVHLRRWRAEAVPPPPPDTVCNLCGGRQFIVLYRGRAGAASRPDLFCCTSFGHGDFTNILRCVSCSLVFQAPADAIRQIEECYRRVQDPVYLREEQGRVRTFDRLLDEIDKVQGPKSKVQGRPAATHDSSLITHHSSLVAHQSPGRLLDVGCYTGVFLDRARRRGWEVSGLEPSRWAADVARHRGFPVQEGLLAESVLPPASFDAVTVWDVIEHFGDPRAEVARVARLLKPGGLLALSTMDVESGFARLLGPRWPWFMRMHLYYFSPDTLGALLEQAGLEVVEVRRHRRIVSARYLLEKAAAQPSRLSGLFRLAARLPFLGRLHIPVSFGDIINVYARKPMASAAGSERA
jgi:dolichol-phosphate mannosyltransferase